MVFDFHSWPPGISNRNWWQVLKEQRAPFLLLSWNRPRAMAVSEPMELFLDRFCHPTWLPCSVVSGRLLLAAILGALVGAERDGGRSDCEGEDSGDRPPNGFPGH